MGREGTEQLEIALYGKGGIGKSTISANLSAALALSGRRVMQIGCDPKHDSTRLLLHGAAAPTVLDYLKVTKQEQEKLSDVLSEGCFSIGCIEAGGPRPGIGCAGRGIISAFEFLDRTRAKNPYDIILYDVLGDVVCGGFAVPVRREYADAIFLVTSGEYMALYAANNILRGIRNFDGSVYRRVAGIIYNERSLKDEDERVLRFAEAVSLPVCVKVPRSEAFALAEQRQRPLMELPDCEREQAVFEHLAGLIIDNMPLYEACPLTDEQLEETVLSTGRIVPVCVQKQGKKQGEESQTDSSREEAAKTRDSEAVLARPPLYGCAFNGAATAAINLRDAIVIAHSPRSCAFYTMQNITSPARKNLFNRGILLPSAMSPNFRCTDMGQTETVFGGLDRLRDSVRQALLKRPGAFLVITSCVSGIIGDDAKALEELSTPETPVLVIPADGDIAGDYMEGIRMATYAIADRLIDPAIKPEGRWVNLINETGISVNREENYRTCRELLAALQIGIHCRFLGDADCSEVQSFLRAPLNILAADSEDGRNLQHWLEERYGCRFMEEALPIGYQETADWLRKIGTYFDCAAEAETLIEEKQAAYQAQINRLKPALCGKRVIITTINSSLDWILDVMEDLEMEVVLIAVMNYLHQEVKVTAHPDRYPVEGSYDWTNLRQDIQSAKPDLVLSNYTTLAEDGSYLTEHLPMTPVAGFYSGIYAASRWADLFDKPEGGWRNDRALFEKYYA